MANEITVQHNTVCQGNSAEVFTIIISGVFVVKRYIFISELRLSWDCLFHVFIALLLGRRCHELCAIAMFMFNWVHIFDISVLWLEKRLANFWGVFGDMTGSDK